MSVCRDLKPANVLLSESSEYATLKLADFGFAKHLAEASLAQTQCGSPLYMVRLILHLYMFTAIYIYIHTLHTICTYITCVLLLAYYYIYIYVLNTYIIFYYTPRPQKSLRITSTTPALTCGV